jgi:hypothetical protein
MVFKDRWQVHGNIRQGLCSINGLPGRSTLYGTLWPLHPK